MPRIAKSHLTAGSEITFADDDAGRNLFTAMRKAGLLQAFPSGHGWDCWGMEQNNGTIKAHIVSAALLDNK